MKEKVERCCGIFCTIMSKKNLLTVIITDIEVMLQCFVNMFGRVCEWKDLQLNVRENKLIKSAKEVVSGRMEAKITFYTSG